MKSKQNKFFQDEDLTKASIDIEKKYVSLKTIKIICNGIFQLIEGQEIPPGIDSSFIESLKNSNLIKNKQHV